MAKPNPRCQQMLGTWDKYRYNNLPIFLIFTNIYPSFYQNLYQFIPVFTKIHTSFYQNLHQLKKYISVKKSILVFMVYKKIYQNLQKFIIKKLPKFLKIYSINCTNHLPFANLPTSDINFKNFTALKM